METRANDRDLIGSYRTADPQGRLEIVFANYHIFPKVIRKMEKKTQYKIKAEREYIRSHARGELFRGRITLWTTINNHEGIA